MKTLRTIELTTVTGGVRHAADEGMFKRIENGRPVWVLTQKDIKNANGNFPLDPRNDP